MKCVEILKLIDQDKIKKIGKDLGVDKKNQKITGRFILNSFLKVILSGRPVSLRSIEKICNNSKTLSNQLAVKSATNRKIDHSSLGKRLNLLNPLFFGDIYKNLVHTYSKLFPAVSELHRFDSTVLKLSSKLLRDGMNLGGMKRNDKSEYRYIKLSLGLRGSLPSSLPFSCRQTDASEDVALLQAIRASCIKKRDIVLFDRGISKATTFEEFEEKKYLFVTRINLNRNQKIESSRDLSEKEKALCEKEGIDLLSDEKIRLYTRALKGNSYTKPSKTLLRLVRIMNSQGEEIRFLTNISGMSALEVALVYKERWAIEVFFKFVKQNLQFTKFVSHSQNGMEIYLYSVLIAAILFLIYKKSNNLQGYKIPLLGFSLEIEKELMKCIVELCRGDPALGDKHF